MPYGCYNQISTFRSIPIQRQRYFHVKTLPKPLKVAVHLYDFSIAIYGERQTFFKSLPFHLQQQVLELRKLSMRILKVGWLVLEHTVSLCYYFMYPLHKGFIKNFYKKYSTTSCIMWPFGDHKLVCLVAFTISHKHCVGELFNYPKALAYSNGIQAIGEFASPNWNQVQTSCM